MIIADDPPETREYLLCRHGCGWWIAREDGDTPESARGYRVNHERRCPAAPPASIGAFRAR